MIRIRRRRRRTRYSECPFLWALVCRALGTALYIISCVCICIHIYIYIYVYIERERETERERDRQYVHIQREGERERERYLCTVHEWGVLCWLRLGWTKQACVH